MPTQQECRKALQTQWVDFLQKCDYSPESITNLFKAKHDLMGVERPIIESLMEMDSADAHGENGYGALRFAYDWFSHRSVKSAKEIDQMRFKYVPPIGTVVNIGDIWRSATSCDGISACSVNYCEVKPNAGGYLANRMAQKFSFAVQTPQFCLGDLKCFDDISELYRMMSKLRTDVENGVQDVVNYLALLACVDHKYTISSTIDKKYLTDSHPKNIDGIGAYNYQQDLFPGSPDWQRVAPLDHPLAQKLAMNRIYQKPSAIAGRDAAGNPYVEFIVDWDWYNNEILSNSQLFEMVTKADPGKLFASVSDGRNSNGVTLGNVKYSLRRMPRYKLTTAGGLVLVDDTKSESSDFGADSQVFDWNAYNTAPFTVVFAAGNGKNIGEFISVDPITQFEGNQIAPIGATNRWTFWNEYSECNKERNMPRWRYHKEVHIQPKNGDGASAFIVRRRVMEASSPNMCHLAPVVHHAPVPGSDCCGPDGKPTCNPSTRLSGLSTQAAPFTCNDQTAVACVEKSCGDLRLQLKFNKVNALACDCGDKATLFVYFVETGDFSREVEVDITGIPPVGTHYFAQLTTALAPDECVRFARCGGIVAGPAPAPIVESWGQFVTEIPELIGSSHFTVTCGLPCTDVNVKFFNPDGVEIAAAAVGGTVIPGHGDPAYFSYYIMPSSGTFPQQGAVIGGETVCSATIQCA
ncbi:MAG: hypothetical protein ACRCWR_06150 [Saezia sp.]